MLHMLIVITALYLGKKLSLCFVEAEVLKSEKKIVIEQFCL